MSKKFIINKQGKLELLKSSEENKEEVVEEKPIEIKSNTDIKENKNKETEEENKKEDQKEAVKEETKKVTDIETLRNEKINEEKEKMEIKQKEENNDNIEQEPKNREEQTQRETLQVLLYVEGLSSPLSLFIPKGLKEVFLKDIEMQRLKKMPFLIKPGEYLFADKIIYCQFLEKKRG